MRLLGMLTGAVSPRSPRRYAGTGLRRTRTTALRCAAPGSAILTSVGVTERLARASSRHPWRTILAWVGAIVVALVLAATLLPGNLTTNGHVTGDPQSKQAENLFQQRFPPDKNAVDELIVVRSPAHTVRDPAFTSFLRGFRARASATGVVYRYSALGVSSDRHAVLIGVQRQADVDKLLSLVERDNGQEGFSVVMTGGERSTTTSTSSRSTTSRRASSSSASPRH